MPDFSPDSAPEIGPPLHYTVGMRDEPSVNGAAEAAAVSDRELLAAFVFHRDARAFEAIVRRHGPMVYGVVRRILRDPHACDDAFQATFLVLARSAGRIRKRQSLASWLHGVARRIAQRALSERYRRQEQAAPMEQIIANPDLQDVETTYEQQLLDSELESLPQRYREPLVLHYLEGLSNREVAERLGLTVTAVEGRLKRARTELRLRMTRRGVELSAIVALLPAAQAAANPATLQSLIAVAAKAGIAASAGTLPTHLSTPQAAALAGKELALMTTTTKFAAVLAVSIAAVSVIGFRTGNASGGGDVLGAVNAPSIAALVAASSQAEPDAASTGAPISSPTVLPEAAAAEESSLAATGLGSVEASSSNVDLETKIRRALTGETTFQFSEKPLTEAVAELSATHGIPISVDEEELESVLFVTGDSLEVSAVANGIRLEKALDLLLKSCRVPLDYTIHDSVLLITSDRKVEMLAAGVDPRGPEVRKFNAGRIEKVLDRQTTLEFPGNPLRDVVDYLSQSHNIPIVIDETALSEVGLTSDQEVSIVISGITLRSALELLFEQGAAGSLDYVVDDEVLKITTREQADEFLETRVYGIRDLEPTFTGTAVANAIRKSVQPRSWMHIEIVPDAGMEAVMGSMGMPGMGTSSDGGMMGMMGGAGDAGLGQMEIGSDSDGNGTIDSLPGCLVITQTQRIHRQIEELLDQLREHAESAPPEAGRYGEESPSPAGYAPALQNVPLGPAAAPAATGADPAPAAQGTPGLPAGSPFGAGAPAGLAPPATGPAAGFPAAPVAVPAPPSAPAAGPPGTILPPSAPPAPLPAAAPAPPTAPVAP